MKRTIYLPDKLKRRIAARARDEKRSEAEVILDAIAAAMAALPARPRVPLTGEGLGDPTVASRVEELLG